MDRLQYVTEFPDGTLVRWRSLTWAEYDELVRDYGDLEGLGAVEWLLHEAAASICILDQQQNGMQIPFDELYAGTIWIVGTQIIKETGFLPNPENIKLSKNLGRAQVYGKWYEEVSSYIMFVFHKTEEEIKSWTKLELMKWVAKAELVLGQEFPVVSEEDKKKGSQKVKFTVDEHGRRIPVVTKHNLEDKTPINPMGDNTAMIQSELAKPDGDYNLKRSRTPNKTNGYPTGQHPARIAASKGQRVHPLRQKMIERGLI